MVAPSNRAFLGFGEVNGGRQTWLTNSKTQVRRGFDRLSCQLITRGVEEEHMMFNPKHKAVCAGDIFGRGKISTMLTHRQKTTAEKVNSC
jgi:hypothetical protein